MQPVQDRADRAKYWRPRPSDPPVVRFRVKFRTGRRGARISPSCAPLPLSLSESIYFSIVGISTVGYGDIFRIQALRACSPRWKSL